MEEEVTSGMAHFSSSDDGLRELALFAGAGGGILGGMLLGWRTVCAVEIEPYPASVLIQRQNDGILPPFPIWDDVCTFDGKPWRGIVDVVSGGFPCQDISTAGKGAGITGERSGLWYEMARIIGEVRPRFAFVENSPVLTSRGLDVVLGDLAEMGYDARWGVVSAADAGAPQRRERIWVLAYSNEDGQLQQFIRCHLGGRRPVCERREEKHGPLPVPRSPWPPRPIEAPSIPRMADGVADDVDRCSAVGNGQVPAVVRLAWDTLIGDLIKKQEDAR